MRVVLDEDVDRGQVHRRRRHSRALLIARSLSARRVFFRLHGPARLRRPCAPLCLACCFCPRCQSIFQVAMAAGFHLFPFRTEKLSPPAPMVLHTRGRVGSRRFFPGEGSLCDCAGALPCFLGYGKAVPGTFQGCSGTRLAGKPDRRTLLHGKKDAPCGQEGRLGKIFG